MIDESGSHVCEVNGCFEKATRKIMVKVGTLGAISLLVCSDCVTKFQEVQKHDMC